MNKGPNGSSEGVCLQVGVGVGSPKDSLQNWQRCNDPGGTTLLCITLACGLVVKGYQWRMLGKSWRLARLLGFTVPLNPTGRSQEDGDTPNWDKGSVLLRI